MRAGEIAGFAVLCAVAGSSWLLPGDAPAWGVLLAAGAMSFLALAVAAGLAGRGTRGSGRVAQLLLYGAGALGLPSGLALLAQNQVSAVLVVATFAAVPVVVAVAEGLVGEGEGASSLLGASVAGLGGALLLLPVALPASRAGWVGLGMAVAGAGSAGVFGVLCRREAAGGSWWATRWIAAGSAAAMGAAWLVVWLSEGRDAGQGVPLPSAAALALRCAALLVGSAAAIALVQRLEAMAFATRFLLLPLVGFAEAYALLRPTVSVRSGIGALLMLGSAVLLWRPAARQGDLSMSLR